MRKSGVITESEEASSAKCASSAPVFMLSIMLCRFCEGVTDTVVPGQTWTSPPLDRRRTAVSGPAVIEEPAPPSFLLPANASGPPARTPPITGCGAGGTLTTDADLKRGLLALLGFFPEGTTRGFPRASPVEARR